MHPWRVFITGRADGGLTTMGGSPTYTELLTCLEMSREVRNLRGRQAPSTTGSAR